MKIELLWLEDDNLPALYHGLMDAGFIVDRAFSLSEGDALFAKKKYDVLILDTMMPIEKDDISAGYTPKFTDKGNKAGLAFYKRHLDKLRRENTCVLVYSIIGDDDVIRQSFVRIGLPEENILYKVSESSILCLLETIDICLEKNRKNRFHSTRELHKRDGNVQNPEQ